MYILSNKVRIISQAQKPYFTCGFQASEGWVTLSERENSKYGVCASDQTIVTVLFDSELKLNRMKQLNRQQQHRGKESGPFL
jgi:hypothetical protein